MKEIFVENIEELEKEIKEHKFLFLLNGSYEKSTLDKNSTTLVSFFQNHDLFNNMVYIDLMKKNTNFKNNVVIFSGWETFPQLYYNKLFIGGSDMVNEIIKDQEFEIIFYD